jgi:hypothetical protein
MLGQQAKTAHDARKAARTEEKKQVAAENTRMGELAEQKKKKEFAQKQATLRSQQVARQAASEGRASTILGGAVAPVSLPTPGSATGGGLKTILGN